MVADSPGSGVRVVLPVAVPVPHTMFVNEPFDVMFCEQSCRLGRSEASPGSEATSHASVEPANEYVPLPPTAATFAAAVPVNPNAATSEATGTSCAKAEPAIAN